MNPIRYVICVIFLSAAFFHSVATSTRLYVQPHENDVLTGLIGRRDHPGTKYYRRRVDESTGLYRTTGERRKIARSIMYEINDLNPPGNFLKEDEDNGQWYVLNEDEVLIKIMHRLTRSKYDQNKKKGELGKRANDERHQKDKTAGRRKSGSNENENVSSQTTRTQPATEREGNELSDSSEESKTHAFIDDMFQSLGRRAQSDAHQRSQQQQWEAAMRGQCSGEQLRNPDTTEEINRRLHQKWQLEKRADNERHQKDKTAGRRKSGSNENENVSSQTTHTQPATEREVIELSDSSEQPFEEDSKMLHAMIDDMFQTLGRRAQSDAHQRSQQQQWEAAMRGQCSGEQFYGHETTEETYRRFQRKWQLETKADNERRLREQQTVQGRKLWEDCQRQQRQQQLQQQQQQQRQQQQWEAAMRGQCSGEQFHDPETTEEINRRLYQKWQLEKRADNERHQKDKTAGMRKSGSNENENVSSQTTCTQPATEREVIELSDSSEQSFEEDSKMLHAMIDDMFQPLGRRAQSDAHQRSQQQQWEAAMRGQCSGEQFHNPETTEEINRQLYLEAYDWKLKDLYWRLNDDELRQEYQRLAWGVDVEVELDSMPPAHLTTTELEDHIRERYRRFNPADKAPSAGILSNEREGPATSQLPDRDDEDDRKMTPEEMRKYKEQERNRNTLEIQSPPNQGQSSSSAMFSPLYEPNYSNNRGQKRDEEYDYKYSSYKKQRRNDDNDNDRKPAAKRDPA